MLANMASSLIKEKRISTTVAKAKSLRSYVEPLITRSKEDTTHSRREVFSYLQDKEAVSILFREISPKIASRPGGYTRILKTGFREGDNASMCIIELVDYNENMLTAAKPKATVTRRSRRGGAKKTAQAQAAASDVKDAEVVAEAPAEAAAPEAEAPAAAEASAETAAEAPAETPKAE